MLMVMDPRGDAITLPGEETLEPTFGLPAMWVAEYSHCVGRAIATDQASEVSLNLGSRGFTIPTVAKLNPDPSHSITLRTDRRYPNNLTCDRYTIVVFHQC